MRLPENELTSDRVDATIRKPKKCWSGSSVTSRSRHGIVLYDAPKLNLFITAFNASDLTNRQRKQPASFMKAPWEQYVIVFKEMKSIGTSWSAKAIGVDRYQGDLNCFILLLNHLHVLINQPTLRERNWPKFANATRSKSNILVIISA